MDSRFTFIPIDPSSDNHQTNASLIRSVVQREWWRRARTVERPRSSSSCSVLSNEAPSQEDNTKGQIEIESHLAKDSDSTSVKRPAVKRTRNSHKDGPPLPPPITIAWRPKRIKIVQMPESTTSERTDDVSQDGETPEINIVLSPDSRVSPTVCQAWAVSAM